MGQTEYARTPTQQQKENLEMRTTRKELAWIIMETIERGLDADL